MDTRAQIPSISHHKLYIKSGSLFSNYGQATASVSASHATALKESTGRVSGIVIEKYIDIRNAESGSWLYAAPQYGELLIRETGSGSEIVYSTEFNQTVAYVAAGAIAGPAAFASWIYGSSNWSQVGDLAERVVSQGEPSE
jgi:hypothetical protein